ncbi:MAG: hypothetical protein ACK5MX_07795 [Pseudanabaena sp.]
MSLRFREPKNLCQWRSLLLEIGARQIFMAHFANYSETLILRVRTRAVIVLFGNLPAIAQAYRSHHDKGTRGAAIAIQFAKPVTD